MKRTLTALGLILAGVTGCDPCPHEPLPGWCTSTNCDIRTRCQFVSDQVWYDADGDVVRTFDAGEKVWDICGHEADRLDTCEDVCNELAQKVHAVGADCTGIDISSPLENDGDCYLYYECDASMFPTPAQTSVPGGSGGGGGSGGAGAGPGFYCIPDPERAAEAVETLSHLPGTEGTWVEGYDWAGELSMHPMSVRDVYDGIGGPFWHYWFFGDSCGWWRSTDEFEDQDAQCQELCWSVVAAQDGFEQGDPALLYANCDIFIANEMCSAMAMPGDGSSFTWTSSAGTTPSPLTCNGACCDDVDVGACYNLRSGIDIFQVADKHPQLVVPFKLDANGAITNGTLVGTMAYSAPTCGSGNVTCPFYLEHVELHLPGKITGNYRPYPGAPLKKFSGLTMEAEVLPVMGGWRPASGQFQLQARRAEVHLTTQIAATGLPTTPIGRTTNNEKVVTGTIAANGTVTVGATITLAPGIVLTLGTP